MDTACSSSLVATHLAHRGLLDGESSGALAGGSNIMLSPITTVAICQLQASAACMLRGCGGLVAP